MAYEFGVIGASGADDFILKAKTFLEANGWTITYFGTYNSHNRLHVSKGGVYFCIYWASTTTVCLVGHTAYDPALAPASQVGASAVQYISYTTSGLDYFFVTFGESFYWYLGSTAVLWNPGGFGILSEKVGAWADGMFVCAPTSYTPLFGYNNQYFSIRVNGVWTTIASGAVLGAQGSDDQDYHLRIKMPCEFNAAILALPITIFRRNITTPSLLHPIGFAPNIKRCNGGDIYSEMEVIIINGESWMIMGRSTRGNVTDAYLFRVA